MNESRYEPMQTGPQETNLPETVAPSITESVDMPDELRANLSQESEHQADQVNLETYEPQPQTRETPRPKLKKDEYKNMAQMRIQLEQAQRERDQALRKLQERTDMLGDDDIAEGRHFNRVQQEIKSLKEELIQTRLKAQYPDFDAIVNVDNLSALREAYPELAATIQSSPDLYTQAASAYTLIKKFGLAPDHEVIANKNRVAANYTKPRPASSLSPQQGQSPLSRANAFSEGLTDDLRKELLKEMQSSRLNY